MSTFDTHEKVWQQWTPNNSSYQHCIKYRPEVATNGGLWIYPKLGANEYLIDAIQFEIDNKDLKLKALLDNKIKAIEHKIKKDYDIKLNNFKNVYDKKINNLINLIIILFLMLIAKFVINL